MSIREISDRAVPESHGPLASTIAHDLNNLLMIVAASCERLSATAIPAGSRAEIERISVATTHASALTAQLLAAGRGARVHSGATDLGTALIQTARLLEHSLGRAIDIEMNLSPLATWVGMSEGAIAQVMINLALNARDAMPGGGRFAVSTSLVTLDDASAAARAVTPGRFVRLDVCDNGTGMSIETRARAFERFFTTKPEGRGTGLGLASVQWAVEQCGGAVELHSASGAGTHVSVLLPVVEPGAPASVAPSEALLKAPAGEIILVAEDEPVVREMVAGFLRGFDYTVIEAGGAEEAMTLLTSAPRIDVLLADIAMPDGSGLELAKQFANRSPETRIVFMSGFDDGVSAVPTSEQSIVFLQKPFTSRTLGERVREALARPTTAAADQRSEPTKQAGRAPWISR